MIKWEKDDRFAEGGWVFRATAKNVTAWVTVENHGNDEWYICGHAQNGKVVHHDGGHRCPPPTEEGKPNEIWSLAVPKLVRHAVAALTMGNLLGSAKKKKTVRRLRIKR